MKSKTKIQLPKFFSALHTVQKPIFQRPSGTINFNSDGHVQNSLNVTKLRITSGLWGKPECCGNFTKHLADLWYVCSSSPVPHACSKDLLALPPHAPQLLPKMWSLVLCLLQPSGPSSLLLLWPVQALPRTSHFSPGTDSRTAPWQTMPFTCSTAWQCIWGYRNTEGTFSYQSTSSLPLCSDKWSPNLAT